MMQSKRVLIVHRYFYPDTPTYARLLKKIADYISDKHQVNVLTTCPSYYGSENKKCNNNTDLGRDNYYPCRDFNTNGQHAEQSFKSIWNSICSTAKAVFGEMAA